MKMELLGNNQAIIRTTFEELEKNGFISVTDYCRALVENFGYQEGTLENSTIEVYRGDMKCLTVTDIKKAAKIMPDNGKWIKYDKTKRGKAPAEAAHAFK